MPEISLPYIMQIMRGIFGAHREECLAGMRVPGFKAWSGRALPGPRRFLSAEWECGWAAAIRLAGSAALCRESLGRQNIDKSIQPGLYRSGISVILADKRKAAPFPIGSLRFGLAGAYPQAVYKSRALRIQRLSGEKPPQAETKGRSPMLYHASPVGGLTVLTPHASNHQQELVYLSQKRENVLVYLANAVERHCRRVGFGYDGTWKKWASYGFGQDGILTLEEYYPNAARETYQGVGGYVYACPETGACRRFGEIPFAVISQDPVRVCACEWVEDAYEAILEAQAQGKLRLVPYEEHSPKKLDWIKRTVLREYEWEKEHEDYREFLQAKFPFVLTDSIQMHP